MLLTETDTNFLEDLGLFAQVGDVATGADLNGLLLGAGAGFVQDAGLFGYIVFDLIKLFSSIHMCISLYRLYILTIILKHMISISIIGQY